MTLVGDAIERRDTFTLEQYPREHSILSDEGNRASQPEPHKLGPVPIPSLGRRTRVETASAVGPGLDAGPVPVERYRRLAAALQEAQIERGLRTVMVTSAVAGEGKTQAVVSLALTLTESFARRVLLIDADLGQPSIHEILGMRNDRGLTEALRAERLELPLFEVAPLLSVLSAGQPEPNPRAALTSDRMRALLHECAGLFDWVLIDAPPVSALFDAQFLARLTQAAVFVIDAGSTPFPVVEKAMGELGHECIIGTILNGVEERAVSANR
jgi:capsular exopolysaccharide synthesis family protein